MKLTSNRWVHVEKPNKNLEKRKAKQKKQAKKAKYEEKIKEIEKVESKQCQPECCRPLRHYHKQVGCKISELARSVSSRYQNEALCWHNQKGKSKLSSKGESSGSLEIRAENGG